MAPRTVCCLSVAVAGGEGGTVAHWEWIVGRDDQRVRYFLRVDPPPQEGAPLRVPPHVREQVLEGLRHRFDPKPRNYWEAIDITSLRIRGTSEFDLVNAEAHRRLGSILDHIEPRWRRHYVLMPALRQPHRSPLPQRLP